MQTKNTDVLLDEYDLYTVITSFLTSLLMRHRPDTCRHLVMDSLVCSRVTLSVPPQALSSLSAGRRAVRCSSALLFTAAALLPGAACQHKHGQMTSD